MQLALQNGGRTTFGQAKAAEPVRETVDEEEALSENQNDHQNSFTAKDAKDAKEEEGLPRMGTDERGLELRRRSVEWKPTPDMYRMDTREGMEAYEASFRMKIGPWLGQAGTPPRAPAPHQHGETQDPSPVHANLPPS